VGAPVRPLAQRNRHGESYNQNGNAYAREIDSGREENQDAVNTDFVFGILAGIGGTLLGQRLLELAAPLLAPPKPMRLQETSTFSAVSVATVEPAHRLGMWQTYTRSIIHRGERCKSPFNVRQMRERWGVTYPTLTVYLDLLEDGKIISRVGRGKTVFLVGYADRRLLANALPYPTDSDPPAFGERAGVTGVTGRNRTEKAKQ